MVLFDHATKLKMLLYENTVIRINVQKSSISVLSAANHYFPQGFSYISSIALAFLYIHARACLQMLRRLVRFLAPWRFVQ